MNIDDFVRYVRIVKDPDFLPNYPFSNSITDSEIFEKIRKNKIEENWRTWKNKISDVASKADIKNLDEGHLKIIEPITQKLGNIVISSLGREDATLVGFALANNYVKTGVLLPHQIKTTTVRNAVEKIKGFYEDRRWRETFFDKNVKLFIIHGCSKHFSELKKATDEEFWNEFLDFISTSKANFIITYNLTEEEEPEENGQQYLNMSKKHELNMELLKKSIQLNSRTNILKEKSEN